MYKKMKKIDKCVYCADFETTSRKQYELEGRTRVYLWELKSLKENGTKVIGLTIEDFFNAISQLEPDCDIFFHNLSFDGEFILHYLLENGYKYTSNMKEIEKGEFVSITDETTHHYLIKVRLKDNGHLINFKCSYRLMPISIAKLGALVGIKKLSDTHDYDEIKDYKTLEDVPEEELKYLENDVEIERQVVRYLFDMGLKGITMASASYNFWKSKNFFVLRDLPEFDNEYFDDVVTKSYHGGITMVNPKHQGTILNDLISYDVNSLYPSVMLGNSMPVGIPTLYKTLEESHTDNFRPKRLIHLVIHHAQCRKGYHPFIPFSNSFIYKGSYSYPRKFVDKEIALWEEEFNLFRAYYTSEYTVIGVLAFKQKNNVFTDYFEHWKKIKETTDNPVLRSVAKLMMNSLYGKFGQRAERLTKIPSGLTENGLIDYDSIETEGNYFYRPIASYITSQARCVLINAMQREKDRFIYCDTDSIYLLGSEKADIPINSKKLGFWKYEGHYTKALFLKAKGYIKTLDNGEQESGVAGLPKELQKELNYENFKDGLVFKGAKKIIHRVKGGVIIDTTDFTLKIKKEIVEID